MLFKKTTYVVVLENLDFLIIFDSDIGNKCVCLFVDLFIFFIGNYSVTSV